MCQLLGMNCNTPTDICFSFAGFRPAVVSPTFTATAGHRLFRRRRLQVFPRPATERRLAGRRAGAQLPDPLAERDRTSGRRPRGSSHSRTPTPSSGSCGAATGSSPQWQSLRVRTDTRRQHLPVGNTDSELAFCHILQSLRQRCSGQPAADDLDRELQRLAIEIGSHGTFNFLLSNGLPVCQLLEPAGLYRSPSTIQRRPPWLTRT